MDLLTDMRERVARLSAWPELGSEAVELLAGAARLSDESVLLALAEAAALANGAARLQTVLAGVLAQRSSRELGRGGLRAVHGHASPTALIQSITGGTKADAARQVRVGTALFDGADAGTGTGGEGTDGADDAATPAAPWDEPLRRALLEGVLTTAQQDAIRNGLGTPLNEDAWSIAAEQLIEEAPHHARGGAR